jgi:phage gp29-like protein
MGLRDVFKRRERELNPPVSPDGEVPETGQIAFAVPNSNRSLWGGGLVRGLSPERLARLLDMVRQGETPAEYLEIAGELEQRDAHYRSVLSTRKHAVEGLELFVQPAGDSARDNEIAAAVEEDILTHPDIMDLRKNALDALGKGFSVNEIIWDTSGKRWKPTAFLYRDPRWFAYEKETGILCLREPLGNGLIPLEPYRFIVHEPNLLSGMQITGGLSFTALFYWLIKTYDVTSWAAFADRFGYPVRLGKYGKKATKEDIATLKRAVAAIGSDVGAVIPDSMVIEIVESTTTGTNAEVYRGLAEWVDKELSKLVLGQTASAEGTPGALGGQPGQEEVRQDICKADAFQFDKTLNRDLVIPYVKFNFGDTAGCPKIRTKLVESKNIQVIVDAVQKLVPLGLEVSKAEMLTLLGLGTPAEGEKVLEAPAYGAGMPELNARRVSLNAGQFPTAPPVNLPETGSAAPVDPADETDGYVAITDEIAAVVERALDTATDFKSFEKELEHLVTEWPADKLAELLAVATFKARVKGMEEFDR